MFDLIYTPIRIKKSTIHPDMPGLLLTNTPKRYVRGREEEQLILFLTLSGQNTPIADSTRSLLEKAAQTYFQTPGSATAALRAAIQVINTSLVERNSRGSAVALKLFGHITAVSLRGFRLVAAQAGQTHALTITDQGCEHYTTLNPEGTHLGHQASPELSFFQAEVGESSRLFLTDQVHTEWEALCRPFTPAVSLDVIQNKVISQIPSVFEGVLIRLALGSGNIHMTPFQELNPHSTYEPVRQPISGPAISAMEPTPLEQLNEPSKPDYQNDINQTPHKSNETVYSTDIFHETLEKGKRTFTRFLDFFQKNKYLLNKINQWFRSKIHIHRPLIQLDHASIKEATRLSNGSMALIAIGVPILISIIALLVYMNKGQTQQSLYYTALAQASVNEAQTQTDAQAQYTAWKNAVTYLDKAENYQVTELTQTLRKQAENAVDGVDKTVRLEYRAAITNGLPPRAVIGKIVATATELYMLDTRSGQVYRATLTGRGYELDEGFSCGPSPFIGELIDIAPLSVNNIYKATLLAIDEEGTLLFCAPEKTPDAIKLTKPAQGIAQISSFAHDSGNLYLLDKPNNSLWIYISDNGVFKDSPFSLTSTAPVNLITVIDLAVNGPDLYLLHSDGHITVCTISYVTTAPTQCNDPATFSDSRPGREPHPMVLAETTINQLEYVPPPDPSIFLFDQQTNGVYHLSLKMNLHRVIKPLMIGANRLPKSVATAFTVSPNRTIFIAFEDQVFVAIAP
ncbi:MAG: hypothetical protein JXR32_08410 [Anaerolineaceae bacterium]|nr:hypothetical protein [Anaerolineaceae bacterium]